MAAITKQELEDAAADAYALERIVNGSATENGTGLVTTRLGLQVKTAAKVVSDLSSIDIGSTAAAQINASLNDKFSSYKIAFKNDVVVDKQAGVVRYPEMLVMRNGQAYKTLKASDYSITAFELPFRIVGNSFCDTHYIDVSLIGTATNPVKTQTSAGLPDIRNTDIVLLGTTYDGAYQCFWGGDVVYTDRPAIIRNASTQKPILIDRNNRLGGGPAVYAPKTGLYLHLPVLDISTNATPTNTESTELAGYVKFALTSASPSTVQSLYYDVTLNQYVLANYSASQIPEGDSSNFVPIVYVWGDSHVSPCGFLVEEYDTYKLRNRLSNSLFNFRYFQPILDSAGLLGGGPAVYLPKEIYIRDSSRSSIMTAINAESAERAGFVKFSAPNINVSQIVAVFFKKSTSEYIANAYDNVTFLLDMEFEGLDDIVYIGSFWHNNVHSPTQFRMSNHGIVENQTLYGVNADGMPRKFSGTTITDITEPNLLALGFTRGAVATGTKRPYFGDNFKYPKACAQGFFRCYVETDIDDKFNACQLFIWTSAATYTTYTMRLEKILSTKARVFSAEVDLPNENNLLYFYVGMEAGDLTATFKITGVQYHVSDTPAQYIRLDDYPSTVVMSDVNTEARDAANIARSNAIKNRIVSFVQKPTAKYNTKVVYGQSLGRGQETSPSLSRINWFGNLTLGSNVLPNTNDGANYSPFTDATLRPLVAQAVNGATVYPWGTEDAGAFGEPVNHGWVNFAKHLHNQEVLAENDTARLFVTFNPSVSGKTIEQLSKVNTQDATNRYSRFTDGLTKIETATGGEPHVVDGIMWMQGEYNYYNNGGSWNKATYKTLLTTLIDNMVADCKAITGQTLSPAFFTYQTGAAYTRDVDSAGTAGLHVGMAQLEVSLEKEGVWMVGPVYPYTDKGGHLTSNGSRWFANQVAKIYHRVARLGQDWEPLRPIKISQEARQLYVDFHVPEAPLVFDLPYVSKTATDYAAKGFRVTDASGSVSISSVEIVGNTIVRINLSRDTTGTVYVWYADKTVHNGNGCLRDSDRTVAFDNYVYKPEDGMDASENIATLVDKPYPLHNWCVAFYLPVGYDEA